MLALIGLELLSSSDLPASASRVATFTGVCQYAPGLNIWAVNVI